MLQWLNREELTVAAELRQHRVFSVRRNPTGRVISAKVTGTSLNQLQNVSKEFAVF